MVSSVSAGVVKSMCGGMVWSMCGEMVRSVCVGGMVSSVSVCEDGEECVCVCVCV